MGELGCSSKLFLVVGDWNEGGLERGSVKIVAALMR